MARTDSNDRMWISRAIRRPGAFRAKARRTGKSTQAYAREVLSEGGRASTRTRRQANLALILARLRPVRRRKGRSQR